MKKIKRIYKVLLVILLILIFTNPSPYDFKSYLGASSSYNIKRKFNFFVCSVYEKQGAVYLGVAGNFIHLTGQASSGYRIIF